MPKLVEKIVRLTDVKVGDMIPQGEKDLHVMEVKRGTKNATVLGLQGEKVYASLQSEITILRSEPTDEELAAKRQRQLEDAVDDFVKEMRDHADRDILAEFAEDMARYSDFAQGFGWYAEDALVASHTVSLAKMFVENFERHDTRLAAVLSFEEQLKKSVLQGARFPQRSNSQMANAAHAARIEAAAKLLENYSLVAVTYYVKESK